MNSPTELIEQALKAMITLIGDDPERDGLSGSPARFLKAMKEMTSGYEDDPAKILSVQFEQKYDELIILRNIEFTSLCVPSKEIVNTVNGFKRAADLQIGDWLWAIDDHGSLVKTQIRSFTPTFSRDITTIKTADRTINLTSDHPVRTETGWIQSKNIKPGMKLRYFPPHSLCRRQYTVSEGYDLGFVIGALGADGSIQDERRMSLCVKDEGFANMYADCYEKAFGILPNVEPVMVPSGFLGRDIQMYRVRTVSSYLGKTLLHWFGGSKATKDFKFPKVVTRSEPMMKGFLDGYVAGDGWCSQDNKSRFIVSSNFDFLEELGMVLGTIPGSVTRSGYSPTARIMIPAHWYRNASKPQSFRVFEPNQEIPLLPTDSIWTEVLEVTRKPISKKPTTVYTIGCSPYHSFLVSGISVKNCEHHFLPFTGTATVGYIPNMAPGCKSKVVGLSKLARLVDCYSRRFQIQERMTSEIADALEINLTPAGIGVIIKAVHECMSCRGVRKQNADMITSVFRGVLRGTPEARAEFLMLTKG